MSHHSWGCDVTLTRTTVFSCYIGKAGLNHYWIYNNRIIQTIQQSLEMVKQILTSSIIPESEMKCNTMKHLRQCNIARITQNEILRWCTKENETKTIPARQIFLWIRLKLYRAKLGPIIIMATWPVKLFWYCTKYFSSMMPILGYLHDFYTRKMSSSQHKNGQNCPAYSHFLLGNLSKYRNIYHIADQIYRELLK